jgi:hypothetical protein
MAEEILEFVKAVEGAEALRPKTQTFLKQLTDSFPEDVVQFSTGMNYGEQSKYLHYDIPAKKFPEAINLLQLTDVQFGHRECKYKRVIEYRDWVLARPERFLLFVGDMIDAWALWSPGMGWDQLFNPQSQVMQFVKIWGPARHRILGYVGGNHERRAIPGFGDLGVLIASLLRIPYSNGRQLIDISYGAWNPFKITMWHGAGGARTKGTVAQILDRYMQLGDSDLYLMGHVHKAMIIPDFKEVRVPGQRKIKVRKSFGVVGTSFLETFGTYGEVAGYNSSDVIMGKARLEETGKWELSLR